MSESRFENLREKMVVSQAMVKVARHEFISADLHSQAYSDYPLPIGSDQTISQPYIVALMSELLQLKGTEKVLEVGTGSGYQAAVLAEIAKEVYSVEIVGDLAKTADKRLERMGYDNVFVKTGDGYNGWPEHAPFERIILTAAPEKVPDPLKAQLAEDGILVAPVGLGYQELIVLKKSNGHYERKSVIPVRFVPMTGRAQE